MKTDRFSTNPCRCLAGKWQSGRKEPRICIFPGFYFLCPVGTLDGSFVRSTCLPSCGLASQWLSSMRQVSFYASLSPSKVFFRTTKICLEVFLKAGGSPFEPLDLVMSNSDTKEYIVSTDMLNFVNVGFTFIYVNVKKNQIPFHVKTQQISLI